MKRLLASSPAAFGVVLGLFILMTSLIQNDAPASVGVIPAVLVYPTFIETPPEEPPKPKPPETVVEQPPTIESVDDGTTKTTKIDVSLTRHSPNMKDLFSKPDNFHTIGSLNTDGDAANLVTIEAQYPPIAIQKNLEGWVKLGYDINNTGRVENVKVIDSKPRGVFDRSARRALLKWKYKPSVIDGEAVASIGREVMLEFNLEKE